MGVGTHQGIPSTSERGAKSEVAQKVGKVVTLPLPPGGVPSASERGAKSEVAHKWARWLHNPCRLGSPHRFRARCKIRSGPQVGKVATLPLPPGGSPALQSGGQMQKWLISGQGGYITLAALGVPTASAGAESEVAHKWARWLDYPCRPGGPCRFRARCKIKSGPQVGKVATLPLPPWGSPALQSGGKNQKWPTSGQGGYITPAAWGVRSASERGAKSEVAHKWARWLHNPCRLGIPTASERGAKSEVAHKWARWLHNPCRPGGFPLLRAGGRIRSGPQVGKVAT